MADNVQNPSSTKVNEGALRDLLDAKGGWSKGLQEVIIASFAKFPYRFFICDNSGSMNASDGKKFIKVGNENKLITCTRWSELSESMRFHALLSDKAFNCEDSRCSNWSQFRLLNGTAPVDIGDHTTKGNKLQDLNRLLDQDPSGQTPLCKHIREVTIKIASMKDELVRNNTKAVVIIATDGESSDGDLAEAMKPLETLPVWVVVRLCTDSEAVVDYWNNIDQKLELDMDVLDDLSGEEEEVNSHNPWLTYGPPLHLIREFGIDLKEFDLLDEARLSNDQIHKVAKKILGGETGEWDACHPDVSMQSFVSKINERNFKIYSCKSKRMENIIRTEFLVPGLRLDTNMIPVSNQSMIAGAFVILAIIIYLLINFKIL